MQHDAGTYPASVKIVLGSHVYKPYQCYMCVSGGAQGVSIYIYGSRTLSVDSSSFVSTLAHRRQVKQPNRRDARLTRLFPLCSFVLHVIFEDTFDI